jgi:aminoglycoside 6'-N-acetyltransferase I
MIIRQAVKKDFNALVDLGLLLWPDESRGEVEKDFKDILSSKRQVVFVAQDEADNYAGFINVSTRREYIPGVTSFPIGYVEAIYVRRAYRRQGLASKLLEIGEQWARDKGCKQMASDTWLWNSGSQEFHKKAGFSEEERLVFFIKRIDIVP